MVEAQGKYLIKKSESGSDLYFIVKIKVRPDSLIPDFDVIEEIEFSIINKSSLDSVQNLESVTISEEEIFLEKILTENGGMFVNDSLKLKEKDLMTQGDSNTSENLENLKPLPALRALKKAIYNYLENTDQTERLRKAQEEVICHCRNVTNAEIKQRISEGYKTFEEIKKVTTACTSCGTCENRVKLLLQNSLK